MIQAAVTGARRKALRTKGCHFSSLDLLNLTALLPLDLFAQVVRE